MVTIKCFICDEEDIVSHLRKVESLRIGSNLKQCVIDIGDLSLAAKLSGNDLVSQEVKYHLRCLSGTYNKARKVRSEQSQDSEADR